MTTVREARRRLREAEHDELLPLDVLAVAWCVSRRTIRKWIRAGILPCCRLGRTRHVRVRGAVARAFEHDQRLGRHNPQ